MDTKLLKQKILDLAIRGKLVPQDPNDEPASVLLERIRAEKERLIAEGKIKRTKSTIDNRHYENVPFEIPSSWEWVQLEDFVMAVTDGDHQPPPQVPEGIPFLVISDVNTGCISFENARFVPQTYYDSLPFIRKAIQGDILFTVTGSYGIVIPIETNRAFCFQRHIGLIKTILCSQWLTFVLQSQYVKHHCDNIATGTAQKTVSLGNLRVLYIPIPPLSEQNRIIEEINNWFVLIDDLNKNKEDLHKVVKQAKSKTLSLAISGKLVAKDSNDEPAIELLKRINPNYTLCDTSHYGNLPFEIAKSWAWVKMKDIAVSELGKTLDRGKNKGEPYDYLCSLNVKWRAFDFTTLKQILLEDDEKERYLVRKGDLLICEGGDVGRAAIWESDREIYYQNALHRVRFKGSINQYFYLYILQYYKGLRLIDDVSGGVTIKHFTQNSMQKLLFPLPPLTEQNRIVQRLDELMSSLDSIEKEL
jgi:type I restriction enzyme S subunit